MSQPNKRIEDALERLGCEHEPPAGWEARVLAKVRPRPPWWTRWTAWLTIPVVVIAVLMFALWPSTPPRDLELVLDVPRAGPIMRGSSAHVGDVVTATASGGGRHHAIWVYRGDELVAACPGASRCEISHEVARVEVALGSYGEYTFVALSAGQPLPLARGSYDLDLVAAGDAGVMSQVKHLAVE